MVSLYSNFFWFVLSRLLLACTAGGFESSSNIMAIARDKEGFNIQTTFEEIGVID
jgi:hypothetical protein